MVAQIAAPAPEVQMWRPVIVGVVATYAAATGFRVTDLDRTIISTAVGLVAAVIAAVINHRGDRRRDREDEEYRRVKERAARLEREVRRLRRRERDGDQ